MPSPTVKPLKLIKTAKPISACRIRNKAACATLTWPDGIGRERVRSTLASRSRSTMSFQVQPAPRMAKAPMKNKAMCQGLGPRRCAATAASADDHQHGSSKQPGADRTVEPRQPQIRPQPWRRERIDPVAGGVGDGPGRLPIAGLRRRRRVHRDFARDCRSGCRRCRGRSWYWSPNRPTAS